MLYLHLTKTHKDKVAKYIYIERDKLKRYFYEL